MALKYPNKRKRVGYWKTYEQADLKDYLLVWNTTLSLINLEDILFRFAKRGRKPRLSPEECVSMAVLHVYFDLRFRETEFLVALLSGKHLDHSNCVRWFGKLTVPYVNELLYQVHQRILETSDEGDYIADSSQVTCNLLKERVVAGETILKHITMKIHIFVMYLFQVGLMSIVSVHPSDGDANDSPPLREHLIKKEQVIEGRQCHADKGYFGKENIKHCKEAKLLPNLVPLEQEYSDNYLRKYMKREYDNESRKKTRGLVEGVFGGLQTETDMRMRCRKLHHQEVYIALMGLKHNIRTYLRTKVLMIICYFAPTPAIRMGCRVLIFFRFISYLL